MGYVLENKDQIQEIMNQFKTLFSVENTDYTLNDFTNGPLENLSSGNEYSCSLASLPTHVYETPQNFVFEEEDYLKIISEWIRENIIVSWSMPESLTLYQMREILKATEIKKDEITITDDILYFFYPYSTKYYDSDGQKIEVTPPSILSGYSSDGGEIISMSVDYTSPQGISGYTYFSDDVNDLWHWRTLHITGGQATVKIPSSGVFTYYFSAWGSTSVGELVLEVDSNGQVTIISRTSSEDYTFYSHKYSAYASDLNENITLSGESSYSFGLEKEDGSIINADDSSIARQSFDINTDSGFGSSIYLYSYDVIVFSNDNTIENLVCHTDDSVHWRTSLTMTTGQ